MASNSPPSNVSNNNVSNNNGNVKHNNVNNVNADLQKLCQQEVEDLHHIFVDWFLGKKAKAKLQESLTIRLGANFSHVAPNGRFLRGRNNLISHLDDKYGCYEGRLFTIDIYSVRLVWTDESRTKFLCMYEEWQSWEQDVEVVVVQDEVGGGAGAGAGVLPSSSSSGAAGSGAGSGAGSHRAGYTTPEVNQFGRLSSCLLEKNPVDGVMRWVHVHETWLEDEAPESPAGQMRRASWTDFDDANVLTATPTTPTAATAVGKEVESSQEEEEEERGIKNGNGNSSVAAAVAKQPKRLLLLISSHPHSKDQVGNQELAFAVLDTQKIPYDVLDGADPEVRQERNELFKTSRVWGKYPQFFVTQTPTQEQTNEHERSDGAGGASDTAATVDTNDSASASGKAVFWGDPVRFQNSVDNGSLKQDLGFAQGGDSGTNVAVVPVVPVVVPVTNGGGGVGVGAKADADIKADADASSPVRVLVLVSMLSLSTDQAGYQQKAVTALQQESIPYVTVDGSDPTPVVRNQRNDLFKLSQSWGKYPQFFLVDGAGTNTYWGDRDRFEACTNQGTLKDDLGIVVSVSDDEDHGDDDDVDNNNIVAPVEQAASTSTPAPAPAPPPTKTASDSQAYILVMVSSLTYKQDEVGYEKEALAQLHALDIPYDTLDSNGSDIGLGDRRKELFKLSQSRGDNPQFFRVEKDGTTTHYGGWNRFKPASDNGTLGQELGFATSEKPTRAEPPTGKHVLILRSNEVVTPEQMAYQYAASSVLTTNEIPHAQVDGSDPEFQEKRDELFALCEQSVYPQFFIVEADGNTTTYWGDIEHLMRCEENMTIREYLGFADDPEKDSGFAAAAVVGGAAAAGAVGGAAISRELNKTPSSSSKVSFQDGAEDDEPNPPDDGLEIEPDEVESDEEYPSDPQEVAFLNASSGILEFEDEDEEEEDEEEDEEEEDDDGEESYPETPTKQLLMPGAVTSPIPQDISKKRHISPKLEKYAKPLTWENTLVGISIAGFDIGTSQGPMGDELWYTEMGGALEQMSQSRAASRSRRKLCLPEMVFPTAHVAIEGHGIWLSWDVTDALEEWAKAHREIALHSSVSNDGVQVLKVKDAKLWEKKQSKIKLDPNTPSRFHYDWSYSTPFCGKLEGGRWLELDESGMRLELLTDQSVPILFFDEVILFEDDLHDNGQAEFSVKLRVMPSCAFILARYWLRVDDVVVRVRETRVLIDFFGIKPTFYRDVTWRECWWEDLRGKGLPTDIKSWTYEGRETPEWAALLKSIPETKLPDGICKYAVMEHGEANGGNGESGMMEL
jgi:type 2A phosphatase activator TIP41